MIEHVEIDGVRLFLSKPDDSSGEWIGQKEILTQLLACWLTVDAKDFPLAPRIVGARGSSTSTFINAPLTPARKICW